MFDFIAYIYDHIVHEYGVCKTDTTPFMLSKRNRFNGAVLFILWKPGEHGHKKPYWIEYDSSWWGNFKKDSI